ncbi:MAG: hypothetical protein DCC68_03315 [Planctomycetota bacterium]|nr:MAG: hypothetical protein DCC68_03315 [Planctomycetota bacterium]
MVTFTKYDPRNEDWSPQGALFVRGSWTVESREEALARAPDLAIRFFGEIFRLYPNLANDATFLRWSEQAEDVFAIFAKPDSGFGVQVDCVLGYLIVWGEGGQAEYGHWHEDPVTPALDHVHRLVSGG